jgi:hypothetical protein
VAQKAREWLKRKQEELELLALWLRKSPEELGGGCPGCS